MVAGILLGPSLLGITLGGVLLYAFVMLSGVKRLLVWFEQSFRKRPAHRERHCTDGAPGPGVGASYGVSGHPPLVRRFSYGCDHAQKARTS